MYNFISIKIFCRVLCEYKVSSADAQKNININSTYIFIGNMPLSTFNIAIVFNLNLKTAEDMFTNFGSSINHHQTVCKEQKSYENKLVKYHLPMLYTKF